MDIKIEHEVKQAVPNLKLGIIYTDVMVVEKNNELWELIEKETKNIHDNTKIEQIAKMQSVASSRKAYKALGKDPARYRLSAESLLRRIVKGRDLYRINNVVDTLNLVSLKTGYSIGGYDADKIEGQIALAKGMENEDYVGIGRGRLNIHNLPVLRDNKGSFGTPTSDSLRTSVTNNTKQFLMVIFNFGGHSLFDNVLQLSEELLTRFAGAKNLQKKIN